MPRYALPFAQHKYGAKATTVDGHRFASQAEARRYGELKLLEKAGEITNLELQPKYPLLVNGVVIAHYVGDFRYHVKGLPVVEDVKGVKTPLYRLKKKMLRAQYGIEIAETR